MAGVMWVLAPCPDQHWVLVTVQQDGDGEWVYPSGHRPRCPATNIRGRTCGWPVLVRRGEIWWTETKGGVNRDGH